MSPSTSILFTTVGYLDFALVEVWRGLAVQLFLPLVSLGGRFYSSGGN